MLSSEISNLCFQKLKGNEETSNMNIYIIVGFFPIWAYQNILIYKFVDYTDKKSTHRVEANKKHAVRLEFHLKSEDFSIH